MRNPQTLEDVTPNMRHAILRIAATNQRPIRCNDPDNGGITNATLNALKRRGLIEPGPDKLRRDVWKLTDAAWQLVTAHTPRLLTPAARPRRTERGYTTEPHAAMRDEPEAIDHATQERFTQAARAADTARKAHHVDSRANQPLHQRVQFLEQHRANGVDISRELRVIAQRVARAESREPAHPDRSSGGSRARGCHTRSSGPP